MDDNKTPDNTSPLISSPTSSAPLATSPTTPTMMASTIPPNSLKSIMKSVKESGKKLAIISTLPEEPEMIAISFQKYAKSIMELLEYARQKDTDNFNHLTKDLSMSLKQIGNDLQLFRKAAVGVTPDTATTGNIEMLAKTIERNLNYSLSVASKLEQVIESVLESQQSIDYSLSNPSSTEDISLGISTLLAADDSENSLNSFQVKKEQRISSSFDNLQEQLQQPQQQSSSPSVDSMLYRANTIQYPIAHNDINQQQPQLSRKQSSRSQQSPEVSYQNPSKSSRSSSPGITLSAQRPATVSHHSGYYNNQFYPSSTHSSPAGNARDRQHVGRVGSLYSTSRSASTSNNNNYFNNSPFVYDDIQQSGSARQRYYSDSAPSSNNEHDDPRNDDIVMAVGYRRPASSSATYRRPQQSPAVDNFFYQYYPNAQQQHQRSRSSHPDLDRKTSSSSRKTNTSFSTSTTATSPSFPSTTTQTNVDPFQNMAAFIQESRETAYRLRTRLISHQKESLRPLIVDLQRVEQFYDDQIRRLSNMRAQDYDNVRVFKDKIVRQRGEIERLQSMVDELNEKLRLMDIKNSEPTREHLEIMNRIRTISTSMMDYNSENNTDQPQPIPHSRTKSITNTATEHENLSTSTLNYSEAVAADPFELVEQMTRTSKDKHSKILEGVPQTDQDARTVEKLLNAIEERQNMINISDAGVLPEEIVALEAAVIVAGGASEAAVLPKLDTINDKTLLKTVAATHIQRMFRAYSQRKKFRRIILRKHVAREIFETEVSYVKGLLVIYKQYVIPLRFKSALGEPIVSKEKIETIFYHIREIMAFNHNLLGKIERRVQKWKINSKIGDVFVECSSSMEMYTHYVNNYGKALTTFEECYQISSFKSFLDEVRSKQEKRSLGLLDLLITPIQRIPRYVLMLKEILKYTEKQHPDYSYIVLAISQLQGVAEFINERKRESEQLQHVMKVISKISNFPQKLAHHQDRKLQMEGELLELTEMGKRKTRHLFLFTDILVCTQQMKQRFAATSSSEKLQYEFKWAIKIAGNQIGQIERIQQANNNNNPSHQSQQPETIEDDIPPYAIGIKGAEKHILLASCAEELDGWLQAIGDARLHLAQCKARSNIRNKFQNNSSLSKRFSIHRMEISSFDKMDAMDIVSARKQLKEKIEEIEMNIKAEAKVLYGLQRLMQVYNNSSGKNKVKEQVHHQKEETTRLLQLLQADVDRLHELLLVIDTLKPVHDKSSKQTIILYLERKNFDNILNNDNSTSTDGLDQKQIQLKVYEVKMK